MADATAIDPGLTKAEAYTELHRQIAAVLEGEPDLTARMATVAAMLAQTFDRFFWTGFYVVDPAKADELVVGPYQGTLGCLRIPFGKGVCGVAAETRTTQVVADVHQFPGHIACDSRSKAEIVVPVFDPAQQLIAVLDIDATEFDSFDKTDARALEAILAKTFSQSV